MNINPFKGATEELISNFEKMIGFSLPTDYKQFLLRYNGGTSKKRYSTFFVKELNQIIQLDVLYGIGVDDEAFDLETWYDEFADDLLFNSLVIGDDPGSGLIVLIADNAHDGIYYWDHSFYFDKSNENANTYKIANSFEEFLNQLDIPR